MVKNTALLAICNYGGSSGDANCVKERKNAVGVVKFDVPETLGKLNIDDHSACFILVFLELNFLQHFIFNIAASMTLELCFNDDLVVSLTLDDVHKILGTTSRLVSGE